MEESNNKANNEEVTTWDDAEKLVTEVFRDNQRQAKRWFVAFLITLAALVATNTYWIYVFNSYEYVYQDGTGQNNYNNDVNGDVENVTAD